MCVLSSMTIHAQHLTHDVYPYIKAVKCHRPLDRPNLFAFTDVEVSYSYYTDLVSHGKRSVRMRVSTEVDAE